jgi:hypothetical protein
MLPLNALVLALNPLVLALHTIVLALHSIVSPLYVALNSLVRIPHASLALPLTSELVYLVDLVPTHSGTAGSFPMSIDPISSSTAMGGNPCKAAAVILAPAPRHPCIAIPKAR